MNNCWNPLSMSVATGLCARHRHSGSAGTSTLSIWFSVDPLADKYPGVSPYGYCGNNPVRLVDEDGREIGWIDDGQGTVFGDKNTNSEEEFKRNYAGQAGLSYVSDANNPSSYTLPNGLGKVQLNEWLEFGIEDGGPVGPRVELEFIPSTENITSGWLQTFSSNIPDVDSDISTYTALPQKQAEERFDFQTISPGYSKHKGPLEKNVEYSAPRIINNPSQFHIEAINNLR